MRIKKYLLFAVIFLLIIIISYIGYLTFIQTTPITPEDMCSKISGYPSWADEDGEIINKGFSRFGTNPNMTANPDPIIDNLISEKIYFLYHPGCGFCQAQIEFFGTAWDRYIESGYTVNCEEVMR